MGVFMRILKQPPSYTGGHAAPEYRTTPTFTRREALQRLSAGSLLALGLWPGALRAADKDHSGTFRFLVVNDTHHMSPACGAWLEAVVRQMKTHEAVEFCLLAGDLVDRGKRDDLAATRDIFQALPVPTYAVIGNHDYLAEKKSKLLHVTPGPFFSPRDDRRDAPPPSKWADRSAYEKLFPQRLNYWFRHRGWQFVGLDTSEGTLFENTRIQTPTLQWLDDNLRRLDRTQPTVIFTHFPLGPTVRYRPLNADDLLERFMPYNLQAVFCGHFHGFTERQRGDITLTTNRCCALKRDNHDGTKEKGYFLCTARDGRISRSFIEFKSWG
jgi:predicted MPP superfamily phosphohydrolase